MSESNNRSGGAATLEHATDGGFAPPHNANQSRKTPTTLSDSENFDYDQDHDTCCPPVVPKPIALALIDLIDAAAGPTLEQPMQNVSSMISMNAIINPCRGLLRVRRASDLALSTVFGVSMDFDLLGGDVVAAALILEAISRRYCLSSTDDGNPCVSNNLFHGDDYGSLLRKQINLQYFLDCLRIRFDRSVVSQTKASTFRQLKQQTEAVESIAASLSDILYTMLLSTLTSAGGVNNVSRGERDIGALVATLTECPLGSLTAHVITTSIARLLVKCGVMSRRFLGETKSAASAPTRLQRRSSSSSTGVGRNPDDIALESRLGRNMLMCHYHDIVAPLLLSRSAPRLFVQQLSEEETNGNDSGENPIEKKNKNADGIAEKELSHLSAYDETYPLDWTHHWRLSLLTFVVR